MGLFLKSKDWQLFILGITLYYFNSIDIHSVYITYEKIVRHASFSPFEFLFFMFIYGWPFAIGINLYKWLPSDANMKLIKLKMALLLSIAISFGLYLLRVFEVMSQKIILFAFDERYIVGMSIILVCHIYISYFIAKELCSVELQRPVTWSDYRNTFFLVWFSAIGIWWIQPRINRIFEEDREEVL